MILKSTSPEQYVFISPIQDLWCSFNWTLSSWNNFQFQIQIGIMGLRAVWQNWESKQMGVVRILLQVRWNIIKTILDSLFPVWWWNNYFVALTRYQRGIEKMQHFPHASVCLSSKSQKSRNNTKEFQTFLCQHFSQSSFSNFARKTMMISTIITFSRDGIAGEE